MHTYNISGMYLTYRPVEHEVFNLTVSLDVKIDINYTQQYTITIANLVGCMLLSCYTNELQNPKALRQEITQYSSSIKITFFLHIHIILLLYVYLSMTTYQAAKSMAKLISQSYGESQLAVGLSRGYKSIKRLPESSWIHDKAQEQAIAIAEWASFSTNACHNC